MSVLQTILDRVRAGDGETRVLIFDLDSTLISTQPRNYAILQEFIRIGGAPAELVAAAERLAAHEVGWNVMDDLRARGFQHLPTLSRLRSFWGSRFFRGDYLHHDVPIPGAVDYVRAAHAAGATVVYLTGRDERGMGKGTRESLRGLGFPGTTDGARLFLKRSTGADDLVHKQRALDDIRPLGTIVATFENEPANANLFASELPESQTVLIGTVCSPKAPPLRPEIVRVPNFRW